MHDIAGKNHSLTVYTICNDTKFGTIGRQNVTMMKAKNTDMIFPKLFPSNGDRQAFANGALSALNNVFWVIKAGRCLWIIASKTIG